NPPALAVHDLRVGVGPSGRQSVVVDGVSFTVPAGGRLALVGESGSGKSMTAMAIAGLLPGRFRILSGDIKLAGETIDPMARSMTRRRGRDVSVVFQDPMSALNPVMTIGAQLIEAIRVDTAVSRKAARKRAIELLEEVQIARAAERLNAYPHEFSGGMRQRVMIAIALANRPRVLIADEPTTALDVTTQVQILRLIDDLCRLEGAALLLITHDIGLV
ncbi:MAG: ABC transporter ATP-binding protein, partial [Roseicyclus sp.]|nr:ABC transporter ATP-binding protein [Roseicyclus sp.]